MRRVPAGQSSISPSDALQHAPGEVIFREWSQLAVGPDTIGASSHSCKCRLPHFLHWPPAVSLPQATGMHAAPDSTAPSVRAHHLVVHIGLSNSCSPGTHAAASHSRKGHCPKDCIIVIIHPCESQKLQALSPTQPASATAPKCMFGHVTAYRSQFVSARPMHCCKGCHHRHRCSEPAHNPPHSPELTTAE